MLDQHFPAAPTPADDIFGPLEGGERVLWRGRAGVAEYAFDQAASLPRWTLPETTEVLVTDRRVIYASEADEWQISTGELRWLWPQHLRVQPGARTSDRGGAATQIQLVCGSADGSFPALVFAGGELSTVADADRMANVVRQAVARFRVDNAEKLGLGPQQARMLSRLLIGPEFSNYQGGEGQTVSLLGALQVSRPTPQDPDPAPYDPSPVPAEPPYQPAPAYEPAAAPAYEAATEAAYEPVAASNEPTYEIQPAAEEPTVERPRLHDEGTRLMSFRPGIAQDATRAWEAARAEEATQQAQPDLASRAAALAARVAELVSQSAEPSPTEAAEPAMDEADRLARFEVPTTNLTERAESLRRSAARFAGNAARTRVGGRNAERESGVSTRGNRNG